MTRSLVIHAKEGFKGDEIRVFASCLLLVDRDVDSSISWS